MTTRKLNHAQEIELLKNQIHNVEIFMASAVKEAEALDATAKKRILTKQERKRVDELIEYIHEKNVFLVNARKTVKAFYAPVSA